jgi:alpha-1,2-mannosyltransferase
LAERRQVLESVGSVLLRRSGLFLAIAVAAEVVAVVVLLKVRAMPLPHIDVDLYRVAVKEWLDGGDVYGKLPPTRSGWSIPYIYPPFALVALYPLAAVPWGVAVTGWFTLSLLALAATLYVVVRRSWPDGGPRGALVVALLVLPFATVLVNPVRETLGIGQINLILMGLVAVDCLAERPRWPRGLLLGLALAIKVAPAAFLVFLLLRKDVRAVLTSLATAAVATLVGFAVMPGTSWDYWTGGLAPVRALGGVPTAANQNLRAVLARFDVPAAQAVAVVLALLVAAVTILARWWALRRRDPALALMLNALGALLVAPIAWTHHWVWIAPALVVLAARGLRGHGAGWLVAAVATFAVFCYGWYERLPMLENRELDWSLAQHVPGDAYVAMGVVLLVAAAVVTARAKPWADNGRAEHREQDAVETAVPPRA